MAPQRARERTFTVAARVLAAGDVAQEVRPTGGDLLALSPGETGGARLVVVVDERACLVERVATGFTRAANASIHSAPTAVPIRSTRGSCASEGHRRSGG